MYFLKHFKYNELKKKIGNVKSIESVLNFPDFTQRYFEFY